MKLKVYQKEQILFVKVHGIEYELILPSQKELNTDEGINKNTGNIQNDK